MYAIRKKKSFLSNVINPEYLAHFTFKSELDYRSNPCGYFAQHLTFIDIIDAQKLALEYDGVVIQVKPNYILNTATYNPGDPNCYRKQEI